MDYMADTFYFRCYIWHGNVGSFKAEFMRTFIILLSMRIGDGFWSREEMDY